MISIAGWSFSCKMYNKIIHANVEKNSSDFWIGESHLNISWTILDHPQNDKQHLGNIFSVVARSHCVCFMNQKDS